MAPETAVQEICAWASFKAVPEIDALVAVTFVGADGAAANELVGNTSAITVTHVVIAPISFFMA